ncbi:hypothetical protein [Nocardia sp. NPDC005366]|uniref:hypothetical protein n=1 Tax=Nocardia sp. NPDC005366 TaxID=3156878 RepID=UPI00339FE592
MDTADTGLIAPQDQSLASIQNAAEDGNQIAAAMVQNTPQAIQDLSLPQLPEDMAPIEAPEFYLAKKISDDAQNNGAIPGGLPGLNGGAAPDAQSVLGAAPTDVSGLLGDANTAIGHATAQAQSATQGVLDQANGVVGSALSTGAAQVTQAAASIPTSLSSLPALPADPVAALMNGLSVPALPGVDQLLQPILSLLSSFGTGVLGALDPTQILSQASQIIDKAVAVGKGSMATVEQVWEGQSARSAQAASQKAAVEGQETSGRGVDISQLTEWAASDVQRGNTELVAVVSSFVTQAVAMAPVILTPPGQAALIASATEHLGNAVTVVNATRGQLAGKTAELNGVVAQMLGQSGLPAPQDVAQAAIQNIGEPLLSEAQDTATKAAGLGSDSSGSPSLGSQAPTSAQSAGQGSSGSPSSLGALGTARSGGSGGRSGGSGSGSGSSSSARPGAGSPGSTVSPLRSVAGLSGTSLGSTGTGASTSAAGTGNSFMGGGAGAGSGGRGGDDDQHSRTVQPYQSIIGNDDLTGPLGESTPDVIGAPHSDELLSDYEQDQF